MILSTQHYVSKLMSHHSIKIVHHSSEKMQFLKRLSCFSDSLLVPDARRGFLLLSLVPVALSQCTSVEQIRAVLSPRLVTMVMKQATTKDAVLAAAVKKLCHDIESFCAGCKDDDMQIAVITSLLTTEGGLHFDQKVKVNTLTKITTTVKKYLWV